LRSSPALYRHFVRSAQGQTQRNNNEYLFDSWASRFDLVYQDPDCVASIVR
jgi:hypothetical protein